MNLELEMFDERPEWRLLLAAYAATLTTPENDWVPRLHAVEGLAGEQLPGIHGKLIALGFLKFELAARAEGVVYQLTPLGKQALLPPELRSTGGEWQLQEAA